MTLGQINNIGTSSSTNLDYNPSVTYLEDGTYVVIFEAESGLYDHMHIERYSSDGTLLSSAQLLDNATYEFIDLRTPRVTDIGNGQFVVNFESGANLNNTAYIFEYDFTDGTPTTLTSQGTVTPDAISEMQTQGLPGGGFMNVWYERFNDGTLTYRLYFETFDAAGNGNGAVQLIEYDTGSSGLLTTWDPQIAYIGDSDSGDPEYRVFYTGIDTLNDQFLRSVEFDPVAGTVSNFETFNIFDGTATITHHQLLQDGTEKFYLFYELNGILHVSTNTNAASLGNNELNLFMYEGHAVLGPDGTVYVIGQSSTGADQYDLIVKKIVFDGTTTSITTVSTLAEGTSATQFQDFHGAFDETTGDYTFVWRNTEEGIQQMTFSDDLTPDGAPTLVGLRAFFETLYVDLSGIQEAYGIDMSSVTYTWFEDGVLVNNQTSDSFTLYNAASDVQVLVSYTSDFGYQEFVLSDGSGAIEFDFNLSTAVDLSGRMAVGDTITADISAIEATNLEYQMIWFVGNSVAQIGGASFDLTADMLGQSVQLMISLDSHESSFFYSTNSTNMSSMYELEAGAVVELDGITLTGSTDNEEQIGTVGDDHITGLGGNDTQSGRDGNDDLFGDEGDDMLFGGAGNDSLTGGAGADTLDGGDGIDTIKFGDTTNGVYADLSEGEGLSGDAFEDVYLNIENARGTHGGDVLIGNEDANLLVGRESGSTMDELYGGGGEDTLEGGKGADLLVGGSDKNKMEGGKGDDLLVGGVDKDKMFGNEGSDEFIFGDSVELSVGFFEGQIESSTGRDKVKDFVRGEDMLVFQDSTISAFGDLTIKAVGENTIIKYANGRIVVKDTAVDGVTQLDSSDFMFL